MTIQEGTGTHNQREVKTRYPVTSGTTLGTTKISGRQINLVPLGINGTKSLVPNRNRKGL